MKICLFILQLIWVIQGADAASMRKYINEEMKVNPKQAEGGAFDAPCIYFCPRTLIFNTITVKFCVF